MKVVLQNLTKQFPGIGKGNPPVIAVNDFCFEIPDGKLIGLLGPSGCGKIRETLYRAEPDLRFADAYRRQDFFRRGRCDTDSP